MSILNPNDRVILLRQIRCDSGRVLSAGAEGCVIEERGPDSFLFEFRAADPTLVTDRFETFVGQSLAGGMG